MSAVPNYEIAVQNKSRHAAKFYVNLLTKAVSKFTQHKPPDGREDI